MTRLRSADFSRLARPFLRSGVLQPTDVHVPDLLHVLAPGSEPVALLGLAFAVRAPRRGHVGVELASVRDTVVVESSLSAHPATGAAGDLPWPPPGPWRRAVASSPLVATGPGQHHRPFLLRDDLVIPRRYATYQDDLEHRLRQRAQAPHPGVGGRPLDLPRLRQGLDRLFPAPPTGPDLQRLAALVALLRPLAVISGGPGTGKTYTVKKLLALLRDQWQVVLGADPRVALAAPTGKAAVRMQDALAEGLDLLDPADRAFLAGLRASTLHRLLGWSPRNTSRFRHGPADPLPHDLVVVDEASMVDLALMSKLASAVRPGARLVLLGDRDQLASVEAGTVLADLTRGTGPRGLRFSPGFATTLAEVDPGCDPSGLDDPGAPPLADCIVHLRRPWRFDPSSGIGRAARAIASGEADDLDAAAAWLAGLPHGDDGPFADLSLLPHRGGRLSPEALEIAVESYLPVLRALSRGPAPGEEESSFHRRCLDLLAGFRVLAAHRRGPLGVRGLVSTLDDALAARSAYRPGPVASPGRAVLVTRNAYEVGRMNGDVGLVVPTASRGVQVAFSGRGGAVDYLDPGRLPEHETVWAMTVHKSQGSQFAHSFVVLPDRPSPILTRELVYTAITRASERVTVAGDPRLLRRALDRDIQRASSLGPRLWGDQPK